LSIGAGVAPLVSLLKPRARGPYAAIGLTAMVMGAVGALVCPFFFSTGISPHAINPASLHPC
jgi:hypothetical protein